MIESMSFISRTSSNRSLDNQLTALMECDCIPCRMEVMDGIMMKYPNTDGRKFLWAVVAGIPTMNDLNAFAAELRQ